ncbi:MAG: archaetidylinositol phosphate synthase [Candidatus Woesearchaeota archaeon]
MLDKLRPHFEKYLELLAKPFAKLKISPNQLTVIGLIITLIGSFFISKNYQVIGCLIILIGSLIDALDGSLSRLTKKTSNFGGFLDSTLDRISDAAIFYSAAYAKIVSWEISTLGMIASFLVSYTRSRAELAGSGRFAVGIAERGERLIVLIISGLMNKIDIGIYVVTILAWITFFQRVFEAKKRLK